MKHKKVNSIAKQASILAIASIIVRAIGLLYRIPLSKIIGDLGNSYYGVAFNIYSILLLFSGFSIPAAVSKLISGYRAVGQYKNANKVFVISLVFITILGGFLSILLFILSPHLLPVGNEPAVFALRSLAPTLFISGFIGVFQGYFQARHNTFPTAIAQIFEQIINALTSILFAIILTKTLANNTVEVASLGALGGTIGTLFGVIVSLIILYSIYKLNIRSKISEIKRDKSYIAVDNKYIVISLLTLLIPIILSTLVTNIVGTIDQYIYYWIENIKGIDILSTSTNYGIYIGKSVPLLNVPSALSYSVAVATLPIISSTLAKRNMKNMYKHTNEGITISMIFSMPCAIGIFILAKPIMDLLFPNTANVGYISIKLAAVNIILNGYYVVLSGVLQGLGRPIITLYAGIIALVVNILVIIPLLMFTDLGIFSLVISLIPTYITMSLICYYKLRRITNYKQDFIRSIIFPLIASLAMGIATHFIYMFTKFIFRFNLLALLITIPLSGIIYLIIIIKMNFINANQIRNIPGSKLILKFLK